MKNLKIEDFRHVQLKLNAQIPNQPWSLAFTELRVLHFILLSSTNNPVISRTFSLSGTKMALRH